MDMDYNPSLDYKTATMRVDKYMVLELRMRDVPWSCTKCGDKSMKHAFCHSQGILSRDEKI